jgi:hypothetical protein
MCGAPVRTCPIYLTDLAGGTETELPLRANGLASDATVAPGAAHALIRVQIIGPDDTQLGESVYSLDTDSGHLREIPGAMEVGPLHRVEWTADGGGAFLQSNRRWAYWTPREGLQLLTPRPGLEVVGVA